MARRSGAVAGLLFTLALSASALLPARAAAVTGTTYYVVSHFTRGGLSASSMPLNGTGTLLIAVTSARTYTDLSITDQLPLGLVVAAVPNVTEAGWLNAGTVAAVSGTSTISLTGSSITPGGAFLSVDVTGTSPGLKTDNLTSTSAEGPALTVVDASIDVVAPPVVSTAFSPASLAAPGSSSLQFTITNPAGNDVALTGVGFGDADLDVEVQPLNVAMCGGWLVQVTPGVGYEISLSGASIAVGASCTFAVPVSAVSPGYDTVTTEVSSDNGGTGNTSTANLSVGYLPPTIGAAFGSSSITAGGSTTLSFTVTNSNSNVATDVRPAAVGVMTLSGIGFTDTLPAGLVVATPNGLTGGCGGGTITAPAGGTTISLAGATLAAGASCTFSVMIVGVSAGSYTDSTGPIGSTEGGPGIAGSAGLTVVGALAQTPTPAPTLAATPPPSSTAAPSSSGDDAGLLLAFLSSLAAASYLAWRTRRRLNYSEK